MYKLIIPLALLLASCGGEDSIREGDVQLNRTSTNSKTQSQLIGQWFNPSLNNVLWFKENGTLFQLQPTWSYDPEYAGNYLIDESRYVGNYLIDEKANQLIFKDCVNETQNTVMSIVSISNTNAYFTGKNPVHLIKMEGDILEKNPKLKKYIQD